MDELLELARKAIEARFDGKEVKVSPEIKEKYSKKQACFVTLTEYGGLRGCIGSLEPVQELWKDVIQNAVHAGFNDYRFPKLEKHELDNIKIELSVLTIPKKLEYKNEEDLLKKVNKKMGIILTKNRRSATFLPQVWEQLPDKIEFLENLCMKAGLDKDDWKDADMECYEVESIEED